MKPIRLIGVLTLALGAALPAPAILAQTAPPARPAFTGEPPENWWQLDPQADRVPGIGANRAYRELLAGRQPRRSVVVAIIDSGIEIDHPDLKDVVWTNPREVAGNRRDDDGNGYVDDVHGWDFIGGRDGRDVEFDTYEGVRLYAACRGRYDTGAPPPQAPAERRAYDECQAHKQKLQADRAAAQETLDQINQIDQMAQQVTAILRQALGTDSLTVARVTSMKPSVRQDVTQARDIYLRMAAAGVTPEVIAGERKDVENRLRYGLNPDFDPRGVVGDNYANPRERGYGNAEVEGPEAMHGTHVAGIVAAVRGNGVGVDGVASGVKLMVLRAVPDGDERDKDVANAIRYAADNGAHVINMSFGKAHSPQKEVVDEAVRYAEGKGVLFVHAAGNAGALLDDDPSYPTREFRAGGAARNWIEVGASAWHPDSLAASFSNYSRTRVDVFAPGMSIYSTVTDAGYSRQQGTSMAAPVVSGLAGLLMAYFPELTAEQVKAIILESATRYPTQSVVRPGSEERIPFGQLSATGGIVNVYEAVRLAQQRTGGARR